MFLYHDELSNGPICQRIDNHYNKGKTMHIRICVNVFEYLVHVFCACRKQLLFGEQLFCLACGKVLFKCLSYALVTPSLKSVP